MSKRERKDASGYCNRCQLKLNPKTSVWLTLDQRTNTYTDQHVPYEFSQGGFEFGRDCAKILLAEHKNLLTPKPDATRNARQDRWYASMNVKAQTKAAHRDGYKSRSEALRLWAAGEAVLVRRDVLDGLEKDNKGDTK